MENTKAMQSPDPAALVNNVSLGPALNPVLTACLAKSLMSPVAEKHPNAECLLFQDRCDCQCANEQVNLFRKTNCKS